MGIWTSCWSGSSYLRTGRNASPYTIKNYGNDIGQFLGYCRSRGVETLERVDHSLLRRYLAELDAAGYVKLHPRQSKPGAGGLYVGAPAGWSVGFALAATL